MRASAAEEKEEAEEEEEEKEEVSRLVSHLARNRAESINCPRQPPRQFGRALNYGRDRDHHISPAAGEAPSDWLARAIGRRAIIIIISTC